MGRGSQGRIWGSLLELNISRQGFYSHSERKAQAEVSRIRKDLRKEEYSANIFLEG